MRKLILASFMALLAMGAVAFAQAPDGVRSTRPTIGSLVTHTPPQLLTATLADVLEKDPSLASAMVTYARTASADVKAAIAAALKIAADQYAALHPGAPNPILIAESFADPETQRDFARASGQESTVAAEEGSGIANVFLAEIGSSGGGGVVSPH